MHISHSSQEHVHICLKIIFSLKYLCIIETNDNNDDNNNNNDNNTFRLLLPLANI